MFAESFQRRENEVKECGLKTVNEVRASHFLAGWPRISSYASVRISIVWNRVTISVRAVLLYNTAKNTKNPFARTDKN